MQKTVPALPHLRSQFLLRPDITYLNFGSFGACPKPIFERYQQYQLELEQEPVQFIVQTGLAYLAESRKALATYLHADADDLVYVINPSHAVNIVAKSLLLKPGDEVLTSSWEYGACDRTWQYYCDKSGATYVKQPIRLPIESAEDFVAQFLKGISDKTKLIFLSHITSSTALRFPVELIIKEATKRGILTFIDGAHAPGQIPLDLTSLNVDFYTGACHKWMMTPKGSSFLYAKKSQQSLLDPLVISWGYNSDHPSHSRFLDYHQTQGTRDFSAFLCIPAAIDFMEENNWEQVSAACRALVLDNAPRFYELLGAKPLAPLREEFILQLCSFQLPTTDAERIKSILFNDYKIEVPVMRHGDKVFLRYSIQAFNSQADLDQLYNALAVIKNQF
jgi:isopenicillin-N epimerase